MSYIGFYNGNNGSDGYNIYSAAGASPTVFGRTGMVTPRADYATTYKDSGGKVCPCPVLVGDEIYLYYEGYDGTRYRIFLEVYDLHGNLRFKPIEPLILETDIPGSHSVRRPEVLYEPWDIGAEFKMVGTRGTVQKEGSHLFAATSRDGATWTILGDILATQGTGWESNYIACTGRLVNDDGVYRIFYEGHDGTVWRAGEAMSAIWAAGIWTRNPANPLLQARGGYNIALTADALSGSKVLRVPDSSLFDVGAPVMLHLPTGQNSNEMHIVAEIPDATTIKIKFAVQGAYTVASGAALSQIHSRSVCFSQVWKEGGKWRAIFTAFQFRPGNFLRETTGYAEAADLASGFTIKPDVWPLPLNLKQTTGGQFSSENLKFVLVP